MKTITPLIFAAVAAASTAHAASFTDDFSTSDNIATFGNATGSASSGIYTLTRTSAIDDAGADWYIGGATRFSLDPVDQQETLLITADSQVGNGTWAAYILFFDAGGTYLDEKELISFSADTGTVSNNIGDFAVNQSVAGAAEYFVRLRIQGDASSGFAFSEMATIPEASQFALIGGLLVASCVVLRRRTRS